MRKTLIFTLLILLWGLPFGLLAQETSIPLIKAPIDPDNLASLQRGAKIFINYCAGCHSLTFMRYNRLAKDIGIVDADGQVAQDIVKDNLIFTGVRIADPIQTAMTKKDAEKWFGVAPPDLSVIARARGVNWLYTYLLSFYRDESRPLGVNNKLFPETAMPDVLATLRSSMTQPQFAATVTDLVNFLNYVGEPARRDREQLGFWVLGFLVIFSLVAFLLKKEYWKNIYKQRGK